MRWLVKRRFNHIDLAANMVAGVYIGKGAIIGGIIVLAVGLVVSVVLTLSTNEKGIHHGK